MALAVLGMLCVVGCGGASDLSGGSTTTTPITTSGNNVAPITVDTGPAVIANSNQPDINTLFVTVTICAPGSTTSCQTIDHIQVDTGSSGFRIINSELSLTLPQQVDASGNPLAECVQFVDGYSYGSVRTADVKVGGETASSMAIEVIGDPAAGSAPSDCISGAIANNPENTVTTFGANGIIGVGPFISDCGDGCTTSPNGIYFACPSGSACADAAVAVSAQVSNPVASFTTDNNGVIIELPSVSATGSVLVSGSLVFGIGTESNNGLGSATVLGVSAADGSLTAEYKGTALTDSFIDSGSNGFFFPDSTITQCTDATGFFCPTTTLSLSATLQGTNGATSLVNFSIANTDSLFNTSTPIAAADDLGGSSVSASATPGSGSSSFNGANSFDFGLPFYFGHNVFTAIETRNTSAGVGPYFAF